MLFKGPLSIFFSDSVSEAKALFSDHPVLSSSATTEELSLLYRKHDLWVVHNKLDDQTMFVSDIKHTMTFRNTHPGTTVFHGRVG